MAIVETVTINCLEVTFARKHVPESVAGMKTYEVDKVVMANAGEARSIRPSAAISLFIGPSLYVMAQEPLVGRTDRPLP
jgi:hypothetical protein